MGRGESYPSFCNREQLGLWKQAFVCAGLGPWQTGHNQAIVCLEKATASYCNYLWKKIFDVFGRGWVWGDVGGRAGGSPLVPSTPDLVGCRGQCYVTPCVRVFGAEKFKTSPALVPGMRAGMALLGLRLIWGSLSCVWAFQSPLTSGCSLCTFARTLPPLWLKSGPAMLILN